MFRYPAVAGQFYPGTRSTLVKEIKKYLEGSINRVDAIGAIVPHAGYIYSGAVAADTIARIKPKSSFLILGPNHTGQGKPYAIMTKGKWKTPLGDIEIDDPLAQAILQNSDYIQEDSRAHLQEHSIEVQLPFVQYLYPNARIVPIVIAGEDGDIFKKIGLEIAGSITALKRDSCILASSDMTHYESQDSAKRKDNQAINAILNLDEDMLLEKIYRLRISMCGYGPATIMLSAAKKLGAKSAELIRYQTSGDITGDYTQVVGYAGILIK
jgi:AmmeMemoRadiSam system protein B